MIVNNNFLLILEMVNIKWKNYFEKLLKMWNKRKLFDEKMKSLNLFVFLYQYFITLLWCLKLFFCSQQKYAWMIYFLFKIGSMRYHSWMLHSLFRKIKANHRIISTSLKIWYTNLTKKIVNIKIKVSELGFIKSDWRGYWKFLWFWLDGSVFPVSVIRNSRISASPQTLYIFLHCQSGFSSYN